MTGAGEQVGTAGRRAGNTETDGRAHLEPGRVHMIVARSKNGVIGADNRIPWRLRDDMRFFREMTTGNTVVMGRKTYESLGRPLPNRRNVVVTRDKQFQAAGVDVVRSPEQALMLPREPGDGEIFVIGGQQIYEALLPYTDVVYITEVQTVVDGDAFFPELGDEWDVTELRSHDADEHNEHAFVIYVATRRDAPEKCG